MHMTMTLGDPSLARMAYEMYYEMKNWEGTRGKRTGWKYLGSGIDRAAWLGPDGYVYKVGEAYANNSEVTLSAKIIAKSHPLFRAPRVSAVPGSGDPEIEVNVIVAEYVQGDCVDMLPDDWDVVLEKWVKNPLAKEAISVWGTSDTHSGNCRKVGDVYYIIDMGIPTR